MYRMERIVPLIGPTVAGPLGVMHLPRMWLKSVLSAAGILYAEYFADNQGFNKRVVDTLGLDPEAWFAFLATMPTYPQTEAYVRDHAALDPAAIAELNALIATRERPEEAAAAVRRRVGLDGSNLRVSSRLIDLDDWHTIHQELIAHRSAGVGPIVPMVSSAQVGTWGVPHLPRLWIKALLDAVHALPAEWKTGTACGFDKKLAETIGLDLVAASAYIHSELPSYLHFERWVTERVGTVDDATKAAWAANFHAMQKPAEQSAADLVEAGAPGLAVRGTILLNDMIDWRYMHDHAVERRATTAQAR
jgi:hypothetical protein